MFIDRARIIVESGAGGDGAVAFRREKYVPRGGPAGGDGGEGGSVIAVADQEINTLQAFRRHRKWAAKKGENGGAKDCFGKAADDVLVPVPLGTLIYDIDTGKLIADMTHHGQRVVLAKGGRGGRGNSHFATPAVRAPTYAEKGEPGERREMRLELKVLADVGLLGYPSVGKSSLIRKVSGAKPQVAAYHFTTLNPILGMVNLDESRSFVMADIPGLIEGASEGVGLGDEFLRHIERTRVLIHVLDAAGSEGRDPIDDFHVINQELAKYSDKLTKKKQLVAANKLREEIEAEGYEFFPICTLDGRGLKPLMERAWQIIEATPKVELETPDTSIIYDVKPDDFKVKVEDGVYYLTGKRVQKLVNMTNFDDYVSLRRFEKAWKYMDLEKLLKKEGIKEGDTVNLYGVEFTYTARKHGEDTPQEDEE